MREMIDRQRGTESTTENVVKDAENGIRDNRGPDTTDMLQHEIRVIATAEGVRTSTVGRTHRPDSIVNADVLTHLHNKANGDWSDSPQLVSHRTMIRELRDYHLEGHPERHPPTAPHRS